MCQESGWSPSWSRLWGVTWVTSSWFPLFVVATCSELGQCPWLLTRSTSRDSQTSRGLREYPGSSVLLKCSLHHWGPSHISRKIPWVVLSPTYSPLWPGRILTWASENSLFLEFSESGSVDIENGRVDTEGERQGRTNWEIRIDRYTLLELPWWLRQYRIFLQCGRPGFAPWVSKIPWRRKWQWNPVFFPGESHGQRNLVG